nr:dockerin type I repeat-containing protein [Clostridiales bacterium]
VTLQPTYTVPGEITYTCIVCGATRVDSIPGLAALPGDADGDGVITVRDMPSIKKALVGADPSAVLVNCDIDGDGILTLKDVAALKKLLAGN